AGMLIGNGPSVPLVTEVDNLLQNHTGQTLRSPVPQRQNPLGKRPLVWGVIDVPDALRDFCKGVAQTLGTFANLQPTVQEALHDGDDREQDLPSRFRAFPAVSVDRLRRIVSLDIASFFAENGISRRQFLGAGD